MEGIDFKSMKICRQECRQEAGGGRSRCGEEWKRLCQMTHKGGTSKDGDDDNNSTLRGLENVIDHTLQMVTMWYHFEM